MRGALEQEGGKRVGGGKQKAGLVEIVERTDHPYFIGCQFHPEYKSRPQRPHPLFDGLVAAALKKSEGVNHAEAH